MQRGGHRQLGEVAGRPVDPALEGHEPFAQQHANGLDGVQRDPLRPLQDALENLGRQAGNEPRQELAHLIGLQRLEHQRGEVAPPGAPIRASVEELGSCEADEVDRSIARPFEDVIDEVEQAVIGPLQVLEDEDHDATIGDALEEDAPGREQRLAIRPLIDVRGLEAQQLKEAGLHPAALGLVGDPLVERGGHLRARRRWIVAPR